MKKQLGVAIVIVALTGLLVLTISRLFLVTGSYWEQLTEAVIGFITVVFLVTARSFQLRSDVAIGLWAETFIGVLLTILGVLFGVLLQIFIEKDHPVLRGVVNAIFDVFHRLGNLVTSEIHRFITPTASKIANLINNLSSKLYDRVSVSKRIVGFLIDISNVIVTVIFNLMFFIYEFVSHKSGELVELLTKPKWYSENGTVDPGLIEVSLAVTAVIVALPGLSIGQNPESSVDFQLNIFRIFVEYVPIAVSIKFIDLYAKDKGSKSRHILMAPFHDGPFFFLAWSILIGFLVIAAATLGLLRNTGL